MTTDTDFYFQHMATRITDLLEQRNPMAAMHLAAVTLNDIEPEQRIPFMALLDAEVERRLWPHFDA